jgi:hypothetical protein
MLVWWSYLVEDGADVVLGPIIARPPAEVIANCILESHA